MVFEPNRLPEDSPRAKQELDRFVEGFQRRLMDFDGHNTSLRVFCRVDVGVSIDPGGKASYFVNEVERGSPPLYSSVMGSAQWVRWGWALPDFLNPG